MLNLSLTMFRLLKDIASTFHVNGQEQHQSTFKKSNLVYPFAIMLEQSITESLEKAKALRQSILNKSL